jgi:hypothetical protein
MSARRNNMKRGGFVADYQTTVDPNAFKLYIPPPSGSPATPGLQGGGKLFDNDRKELNNGFLYSTDGGCAMCGTTGGSKTARSRKGGVGLELAPFISALALLGARLLADKEVGIFNDEQPKSKSRSSRSSRKQSV